MEQALSAFREGRYEDGARLALEALDEKGDMVRGLLAITCLLRTGRYIDAVGVVGRLKASARFHALDCAVFDHAIGHRHLRHLHRYAKGNEGEDLVATCNLLYQKTRGNVLDHEPGPNPLLRLWEADQGPTPEPAVLAQMAGQMRATGAGRDATMMLRHAWRVSRNDPGRHADMLCVSAKHAERLDDWSQAAAQWKRAAASYAEIYGNGDLTALRAAEKAVKAYHTTGDWPNVVREASWLMHYCDRLPDEGRSVQKMLAAALVETDRYAEALPILERLYAEGDDGVAGRLVYTLIATEQPQLALDVLAKAQPNRVMEPIEFAFHELHCAIAYYALDDEERGDACLDAAFRVTEEVQDHGHKDLSWVRANLARNLKAHGYEDKAEFFAGGT